MNRYFPFFPPEASTTARGVDGLYFFMLTVCGLTTLLVAVLVIVFAVRYHEKKHPHAAHIEGHAALEVFWMVIPFGIFMVMFGWGARLYFTQNRPPNNAIKISVVGKQWMWKIQHAEGQREINALHVPVNQPVELSLISEDVIHDFAVPAFRLKMDVLPGRYRTTWFQATKTGTFHLFCDQYCGTQHSKMIGEIIVMEPDAYRKWMSTSLTMGSPAFEGQRLFQGLSCISCHRADSGARGPSLSGLYGQPVHLADGTTVTADENYIRESILYPNAKIVAGFQPIMPTFLGQLNEEQVLDLVNYIKSLAPQEQTQPYSNRTTPPAGPRPMETKTYPQ